jgi:hypothetical protein
MIGLKRRSTALRAAINKFNAEAKKTVPPLPPVDFKDVVSMEFLADLDFLRFQSPDQGNRKWFLPGVRRAMNLYFKMERAQEEILRVAIEASRLRGWISEQTEHHETVIRHLEVSGDSILGEAMQHSHYLSLVNGALIKDLDVLQRQKQYGKLVTLEPVTEKDAMGADIMTVASDPVEVDINPSGDDNESDEEDSSSIGESEIGAVDAVESSLIIQL